VREDTVLGYRVAVSRVAGQSSRDYSEFYRAPDLNGAYLRTIYATENGVNTIEAVKITLGEPSAAELDFPDYPVSFDFYKAGIKSSERAGNIEQANQMRQVLAQYEPVLAPR
jgi:hypothetical protein